MHAPITQVFFAGLVLASAGLLRAQDEVITLSPFTVGAGYDEGYMSSSARRPNPAQSPATSAITLRKRAENVALQLTLENESRNAEQRNREMLDTLTRLVERADATPGIRVHNGEIALSTRDRKLSLFSFGREPTTRVDVFVLGELKETASALEATNAIKAFISSIQPVGTTRLIEGSVGLSISKPERFRRDLLALIFDDLRFIRQGLGDEIDINITGLDRRIAVRQHNDAEVELFLNYNFSVTYRNARE